MVGCLRDRMAWSVFAAGRVVPAGGATSHGSRRGPTVRRIEPVSELTAPTEYRGPQSSPVSDRHTVLCPVRYFLTVPILRLRPANAPAMK